MKLRMFIILALLLCGLAQFVAQEAGAALIGDPRFCGTPIRNDSGRIIRSSTVLRQFQAIWPKPQDGQRWYLDHVIPLACGGCDVVFNLQWLTEDQWVSKSKTERKVYGGRGISPGCP